MSLIRNLSPVAWLLAIAGALLAGYLVLWDWVRRWGLTRAQARGPLPGDELVPRAQMRATQAITIAARATDVWPWLVQMGQGRGGFYSYDRLENLFGMRIHNADRIVPGLQHLGLGDPVPFWPGVGVAVMAIEPQRLLVLGGTMRLAHSRPGDAAAVQSSATDGSWTFLLEELGTGETRLIIRMQANLMPIGLVALLMRILLEPPSSLMQRGMLLGIRRRVQAEVRRRDGTQQAPMSPR